MKKLTVFIFIFLFLAIAMSYNITPNLNPNHFKLYKSLDPELLVYGGAGGGKSYSIADKFLLKSVKTRKPLKLVVIRKTLPSIKRNVIPIIEERADTLKIPFTLNKSDMIARAGNNMQILFQSCKDREAIDRIKGLTNVDYVWVNEITEIRKRDYEIILSRVRGGHSKHEQVISDFNPVGTHCWVFKHFFEKNIGNVRKLRYNILDNHPDYLELEKTKRYIERLRSTKDHNYNFYKIYFLGEWGELKGIIFDWDIVPLPDINFDEVFYGLDFGYSVDPAAVVKIYRKGEEFWIEEVLYQKELTNPALAKKLKNEYVFTGREQIYCDSAEPKSIQELCDSGLNALPSLKGPDSVKTGIDYLKSLKIHIVDNSPNIIKERGSYVWKKNKDDVSLPEPVNFFDHAMDASRYAIFTHMKEYLGIEYFGFSKEAVI